MLFFSHLVLLTELSKGLVLFNAFSKFVAKDNGAGKVAFDLGEFVVGFLYDSVCSPILGMGLGILSAMMFKYVDMRETTLLELCLIMYVPFLVAEMLDLSGIVTILFTGMAARSYVVPNLSPTTADNANTLFRLAAHLAETSIFLELGLSVFGMKASVYMAFIGWSILACLVGRALNVYPLVYLYNYFISKREHDALGSSEMSVDSRSRHSSPPNKKNSRERSDSIELSNLGSNSHESASPPSSPPQSSSSLHGTELSHSTRMVRQDQTISLNTAHMLWFSGLRGAVAYACVRSFPNTFHHDDEFTVTTMVIVLVTVFGLGSTTEAALTCLNIEMNVDEDNYMEAWHRERSQDGLILQVEGVLQQYALRTETSIAVNTDDEHHVGMAPGEASIASGFHHHHDDDDENDHHHRQRSGGGGMMEAGPQSPRGNKKDSVFDYGNK